MRFSSYIFVVLVCLLSSCAETKFVPEGKYLLSKVKVVSDVKNKDIDLAQMKTYIRQKGNSRWFSAIKIPLATYSLAGRDTTKWINRKLQAFGEAPVLFDSLAAQRTCYDIRTELQNNGYLNASVDYRNQVKGKKAKVTYCLHPGKPYYIRNVTYDIRDSLISRLIGIEDATFKKGLVAGMKFDVEQLDNERIRIARILTDKGYYRFHKEFINYISDSIPNEHLIDLTLVLQKYRTATVADTLHPRYLIGNIIFASGDAEDSVIHLRHNVLLNNTFIESGKWFSASDLQRTYNHFGSLQAVKYTNISFRENEQNRLLDCDILLSTNKPSTIIFQPEGTNTAGDLGAAVSLTYQNKNIFRGSELFSIELRGAYEAIKGLEGYSNENFLEYSTEAKLVFPRFIAPFLTSGFRRRIRATSELFLSYDLQNRPEYHRRVTTAGWRYRWNDANHHDRYQVDLLDISYISMPWISDKFRRDYLDDASSRNAILRYNYNDLFIMKFGVGYSYNNGKYAIKANAETAGNVLELCAHLINFRQNDRGQYQLFRIAFAQYAKADLDFTRNFQFDYNNSLIFHIGLGVAYPYGNSTILPFEKRYFSGGANSVRGWSVRRLGPGSFRGRNGDIDFINQTGDLKLDLNLEYRAHLFWKFNGALFVDAGNIWTIRNYEDQPGGQFRLQSFLKELAAAYGFGIRLNFDYFIVRFDFGMKAVNPCYDSVKEHYPLLYPKLSRDFAFHFAVGLPF